MIKLFVKSAAVSFVVKVHIPTWRTHRVGGVSWTQEPIPMKGGPANPEPLALSQPSFADGVASVNIAGGSAGARYLLSTAPSDGRRVPMWVRQVRVQVA